MSTLLDQINANTEAIKTGKNTVVDAITAKGGVVNSSGSVPTFNEIADGVNSIDTSSGGGSEVIVQTIVSAGNGSISVSATSMTENINKYDTVVAKTNKGAIPEYKLTYTIPTQVKIGSGIETPTVQKNTFSYLGFSMDSQVSLISDNMLCVKYTTGNMLLFYKKDEEFVQLKIDGVYQYLIPKKTIAVDYDKHTGVLFVVNIDTEDVCEFSVYKFNEASMNLEFQTAISKDFNNSSEYRDGAISIFASRGHVFFNYGSAGVPFIKYDVDLNEFGDWQTATTGLYVRDFVEMGSDILYLAAGWSGKPYKYQLIDGVYTKIAEGSEYSANLNGVSLNKNATMLFYGYSTTRYLDDLIDNGSTITRKKHTPFPSGISETSGEDFFFTKDSDFVWGENANNTVLYSLVDNVATKVVKPATEFSPALMTDNYGANFYGRPAKITSAQILCLLSTGQLGIFTPVYATAPYTVEKAGNKLSTDTDVYGYGIAQEDINSGEEGTVSLSFLA